MFIEADQVTEAVDAENESFKTFIRSCDPEEIDKMVFEIQLKVTAAVDCTQCGNCCRSLMINVEPNELEPLSHVLLLSVQEIKSRYIEESAQGQLIVNTIPCHFLENNMCTVYENRFAECREFPHLHKKGFSRRLFGTFMHYHRCPIIYNTIELLKNESGFRFEAIPPSPLTTNEIVTL